jgi:hypothetical protein
MQVLKAIVIGFGVLIVVGLSILVVALFKRGGEVIENKDEPAVMGTVGGGGRSFGDRSIPIPRGGRIEEMLAEGDRLIIKLRLPEGLLRLLILDLNSGALLGSFEAGSDAMGPNDMEPDSMEADKSGAAE